MAATVPSASVIASVLAQVARGFVMGAADVVPGVSGGTVALVLGIYQRLVDAVRDGARSLGTLGRGDLSGFWRKLVGLDWIFLVPLLFGVLLAVGTLASVIENQLHENPEEMAGLFFGLVAGSVVVAFGMLRHRQPVHYAVMAVVAVAVFWLLGFQSGPVTDPGPLAFLGGGALAVCAMILPGISGSFILLMIGMYAAVIGAVDERAFDELALLAVGAVIGLAAFSTVLGAVLDRAFDMVMAALIGLMIGSLRVLWPWPNGVGEISENEEELVSGTGLEWPASDAWLAPTLLAVLGFAVVVVFTLVAGRYADDPAETAEVAHR